MTDKDMIIYYLWCLSLPLLTSDDEKAMHTEIIRIVGELEDNFDFGGEVSVIPVLDNATSSQDEEVKLIGRLIVREMVKKDSSGYEIRILKSIRKLLVEKSDKVMLVEPWSGPAMEPRFKTLKKIRKFLQSRQPEKKEGK